MAATGELYRVTYQFTVAGQTVENVVHFRDRTGLVTVPQRRTSAEGFFALWKSLVSNDVFLTNIIIKQLTPTAFDEDVFAPVTHTRGLAAGPPGNNTIALIMTLRTGESGKSKRGRMYIGALPSDKTMGNTIPSDFATIADNIALAIVAGFGTSGSDSHLELGVYSRTIGGTAPATIAGYRGVTQVIARHLLGNQRRRRVGVGV